MDGLISYIGTQYNLTFMKAVCETKEAGVLEAMGRFDSNLKRLEKDIEVLQFSMHPYLNLPPQPQGLDTMGYTETESFQIESESRRSIIDDLDPQLLKQTSHTNYTNQLTAMNYIFEIKEETEIDEISMGTSRREFNFLRVNNDLFGDEEDENEELLQPVSQHGSPQKSQVRTEVAHWGKARVERPKSSYARLKDMMLTELKKSKVIETVNLSRLQRLDSTPAAAPSQPLSHTIYVPNTHHLIRINTTLTNQYYFPAKKHIVYAPLK